MPLCCALLCQLQHLLSAVQPKHRRIRRWDVLWAVFNMGVRFMELYKRRMKRIEVYQRCGCVCCVVLIDTMLFFCHRASMLHGAVQAAHEAHRGVPEVRLLLLEVTTID
jgi:hypothetical protein